MESLWLGLTLLGMVQTQAQGPRKHWGPLPIPGPNLTFHKICLQPRQKQTVNGHSGRAAPGPMDRSKKWGAHPNSSPEQGQKSLSPTATETLQGKWFILGLVSHTFRKEDGAQFQMWPTASRLTSVPVRASPCEDLPRTPVSEGKPSQESLRDWEELGSESYKVNVVEKEDACLTLVLHTETKGQGRVWVMLLGQKKELNSDQREKFINFTGTLGIPKHHVTFLLKAGSAVHDAVRGPGRDILRPGHSDIGNVVLLKPLGPLAWATFYLPLNWVRLHFHPSLSICSY